MRTDETTGEQLFERHVSKCNVVAVITLTIALGRYWAGKAIDSRYNAKITPTTTPMTDSHAVR